MSIDIGRSFCEEKLTIPANFHQDRKKRESTLAQSRFTSLLDCMLLNIVLTSGRVQLIPSER